MFEWSTSDAYEEPHFDSHLTNCKNQQIDTNKEPKDVFLNNYPFYEFHPILSNPPSAYYQQKIRLKPPPEPVPPPKPIPRDINPERLSENQKKFVGKSLFEKDLILIQERNTNYQLNSKKRKKSSVTKPPELFYREEKVRLRNKIEIDDHDKQIFEQKKKQKHNKLIQYQKEKKKIDTVTKERETERQDNVQKMIEEHEKEMLKKKIFLEKMKTTPQRPTRTTMLRAEQSKHKLEVENVMEQREKLNHDLKRERLKKQTKKIASMIDEMNPEQNFAARARQRKERLHKQEKQWNKWLKLNEQTNELKETMLERMFYVND